MKQQGGPTPSSPDKTIRGIVGAHGSAGVKRGPIEWRLVIHLAAWRQPGTEVMQGERRCEMPVTQGELQAFMQRIRPYMIVEAETEENTTMGQLS